MTEAEEFLAAWNPSLTPDTRMCLCGFPGDPGEADPQSWAPRPWQHGDKIPYPPRYNAYVTVASFRSNPKPTNPAVREWRRRRAYFAAGQAFMVDDVGTKVDPSVVKGAPPSAIIETSPGNFQYWYFFGKPLESEGEFDGLLRAFVQDKVQTDPGMLGVTRVGRLPGYRNGKPKYGGWATALRALHPERRYTTMMLVKALGLRSMGVTVRRPSAPKPPEDARARFDEFWPMYQWLKRAGMLKREADPSGWVEMTCPWVDQHTGGVDNGAALRMPHAENEFVGAFKCNHGHCTNRAWRDVTEWIATEAADNLEMAARAKRDLFLELISQQETQDVL